MLLNHTSPHTLETKESSYFGEFTGDRDILESILHSKDSYFVFDIDGVLMEAGLEVGMKQGYSLESYCNLHKETIEKFQKSLKTIRDKKQKIVLCTGRSLDFAKRIGEKILGDQYDSIIAEGGIIRSTRNITKVTPELKENVEFLLKQKDTIQNFLENIGGTFESGKQYMISLNPPNRINIQIFREQFEEFCMDKIPEYKEYFFITNSATALDILPNGTDKQMALQRFLPMQSEMIYFGDSDNDLSSLKKAKIGVIPENANESFKEKVRDLAIPTFFARGKELNGTLAALQFFEHIAMRKDLLLRNPDRLFGVYSLISDENGVIELQLVENCLCLYPNQAKNLIGASENNEIQLLDINALRRGEAKRLDGTVVGIKNPVLLSGGVIEIYGAKAHTKTRDHILLNLRDSGTVDSLQYTSIAGRNIGTNLTEEVMREQMEESPFLLVDKSGFYTLGVRSDKTEYIQYLKESIKSWIDKVKGRQNDTTKSDDIIEAEKVINKLFPKIGSLKTMTNTLEAILHKESYIVYASETIDTYPGVEQDIKTIKLDGESSKYFVYHDKENNTIEYRKIERIIGIPDGYTLAGRGTSRLFLESINQRPNTRRLTEDNKHQSSKKVVPTVRYFIDRVLSGNSSD